ncbi:hypothetical protein JTE90_019380 [Oedothorax gibbosus]|uniref:Uncharacterized protein n=1 Tax=Oedothorax gibbosus TaxID=931172 RepID=A0AAV6TFY9_9ARAC|nr:hypothetical protein JTE90_019380 [Oedothorax gibbosus]
MGSFAPLASRPKAHKPKVSEPAASRRAGLLSQRRVISGVKKLKPVSRRSKPSSLPYKWVNNPTLGEFLLRNDRKPTRRIKKQRRYERLAARASYPCGELFDTSCIKL